MGILGFKEVIFIPQLQFYNYNFSVLKLNISIISFLCLKWIYFKKVKYNKFFSITYILNVLFIILLLKKVYIQCLYLFVFKYKDFLKCMQGILVLQNCRCSKNSLQGDILHPFNGQLPFQIWMKIYLQYLSIPFRFNCLAWW